MKRILWMVAALCLLLAGCTVPVAQELDADRTFTEVTAVPKTADFNADPPTLTVTWYNPLQEIIHVSDDFDILRRTDDNYVSCFDSTHYYADASFTLHTFDVAPRSQIDLPYDITAHILPRGETLWFQGHYSVEDRRTAGIVSFQFEIKEDGTVVHIPTDGGNTLLPPFGGYQVSSEALQSPFLEPSSDERFYLTLDRQGHEDGYTVLDITWHNESDVEAWYGEPYDIEYFDGEHWVSVLTDEDAVWIMPAYSLSAGGTSQKTYTPDRYGLFDLSKAGRYRFSSSCHYTAEDHRIIPLTLTVEFTVD